MRTREEIKEAFQTHGVTIVDWARARGFKPELVYAVLLGRTRCLRGEAHRIAVALGMKSVSASESPMDWEAEGDQPDTSTEKKEDSMPDC